MLGGDTSPTALINMQIIKQKSYQELDAIKEIIAGKSISEFEDPTALMYIAAIRTDKKAWKSIPANRWNNRRLVRMAVKQDFRALETIPEELRVFCIAEFNGWSNKLTRKTLDDYMRIYNSQSETFIAKSLHAENAMSRFLKPCNKKYEIHLKQDAKRDPSVKKREETPTMVSYQNREECRYDFMNADGLFNDDNDADIFLALPVEKQTEQRLTNLLNSEKDFPADFIKRLITPNRNAAFYQKKGDVEKAVEWKAKCIPYLSAAICKTIADAHPEGSAATPQFLSAEAVSRFWDKKAADHTAVEMTQYFMLFPEEMLNPEMAQKINISWQVLRHAPTLLCNSEGARKYLNRNPADVLRLQECYQTRKRILADRVPINKGTLPLIKNEELRTAVAYAFGLNS